MSPKSKSKNVKKNFHSLILTSFNLIPHWRRPFKVAFVDFVGRAKGGEPVKDLLNRNVRPSNLICHSFCSDSKGEIDIDFHLSNQQKKC